MSPVTVYGLRAAIDEETRLGFRSVVASRLSGGRPGALFARNSITDAPLGRTVPCISEHFCSLLPSEG
jgi:hypothetical protein